MHQASVGFHCPECVKAGSQQVYRGVGSLRVQPVVTQILIAVNVAVFLVGAALGGADALAGKITQFAIDWGLIARGVDGGRWVGVGEPAYEWYRMITAGFLHFGIFHIAVNMYALWILGRAVEQFGGRVRYGWIYAISLLAGSVGALILSPHDLTAGASGAIFGLMGALFLAHRAQGISFRESPLLGVLILNLVITFGIGGISIGGHLGGLIGGAFAGWLFFDLGKKPGFDLRVLSVACGAICIGLLLAGVVIASNAGV